MLVSIIDLYERHARAWDALRGPELHTERRWIGRWTRQLPKRAAVLDLGCGTGDPIARHLLDAGFEVTGVDTSPTLLSIARERFGAANWIVADMRDLQLSRTFDGLIAWNSLFHLEIDDQQRMFALLREHAHDGTALLFTSGPSRGESIGVFEGEPLFHASLDPHEYRALLAKNGFVVVDHLVNDPNAGGASVWLARLDMSQR